MAQSITFPLLRQKLFFGSYDCELQQAAGETNELRRGRLKILRSVRLSRKPSRRFMEMVPDDAENGFRTKPYFLPAACFLWERLVTSIQHCNRK